MKKEEHVRSQVDEDDDERVEEEEEEEEEPGINDKQTQLRHAYVLHQCWQTWPHEDHF